MEKLGFDEHVLAFVRYNNASLKRIFLEDKELHPYICMLIYSGKEAQYGIMPVQINPSFFNSGNAKEALARYALPKIISKVNMSGSRVVCLCIAYEASRVTVEIPAEIGTKLTRDEQAKYAYEHKDSYVKKDVLLISYETELSGLAYSYPIVRDGSEVTLGQEEQMDTLADTNARLQTILRKQVSRN